MERKIYNPIQKDQVIFLKTHADTNGECTLVEVELADCGGVGLHYHKTYSEKFDCVEEKCRCSWVKQCIHSSPANLQQQNQTSIIYFETEAASLVNF